jgi:cell division protein DivIC
MTFQQLRENRIFKIVSNKYFLILLVFAIWMVFFDENSVVNQGELNKEIDGIEKSIEYYEGEIEKDKQLISNLKNPDSLEKFAREEYKMKKQDEDIFLIEFDSTSEKAE